MKSLRLSLAAILVLLVGTVAPASAQKKGPSAAPRKAPTPPKRQTTNPAKELDRFSKMSAQERQRELAKLPPQRRAALEQRLSRYQNLSPQQREQLHQRYEQFLNLPEDRQTAVREQLQQLREMPEAQRKKLLNSDEVKKKFSPEELKLLRDSAGEPEVI